MIRFFRRKVSVTVTEKVFSSESITIVKFRLSSLNKRVN